MPFKPIDYSDLTETRKVEGRSIVTTSLGNTIIEIQGELVLPTEKPDSLSPEQEARYVKIDDEQLIYAIRFGKLELDDKKATLFIGTTQRLLGDIKKLNPPLALMKFPNDDTDVKILDIIDHKIIFTGRPLPIM